jgi:hypothetical protein
MLSNSKIQNTVNVNNTYTISLWNLSCLNCGTKTQYRQGGSKILTR